MITKEKLDKIRGTERKVQILNWGTEGQTIIFKVLDVELDDFVINNCYLKQGPELSYNGSVMFTLPDGVSSYFVVDFTIRSSKEGVVKFKQLLL
jgi:hypothetical protein